MVGSPGKESCISQIRLDREKKGKKKREKKSHGVIFS